jgi:hypothetical protein
MAVKGETELTPLGAARSCQEHRRDLGRTPTYHWGRRLIDIDILLYEDLIVDTGPGDPTRRCTSDPSCWCARKHRGGSDAPALGLSIHQLLAHVDITGITAVAE